MQTATARPLVPEDRSRGRPGDNFVKACFAVAQGLVHQRDPLQFLRKDDAVALSIIQRTNIAVGTTTDTGWASELAAVAFRGFLAGLGPYGAAARLIELSTPAAVPPPGIESRYPNRTGAPVAPAFVAEGSPIPVRAYPFETITLPEAKKLAHIIVWSREVGRRSDAEVIFRRMLAEDVAAGLDGALLATTAATAAAPAGLLYGVSPLAGYAGADVTALETDLVALGAAVATGGSGSVTYVMAPERLARLRVLAPLLAANLDIVASAACGANRVVAVDGRGLIIATDPAPDLMRAEEGLLHRSDVPLEIVSDTGPTVADPVMSSYQVGGVALRLIHEVSFVRRRATAAAYLDGATW